MEIHCFNGDGMDIPIYMHVMRDIHAALQTLMSEKGVCSCTPQQLSQQRLQHAAATLWQHAACGLTDLHIGYACSEDAGWTKRCFALQVAK